MTDDEPGRSRAEVSMELTEKKDRSLRPPEELIFEACYTPVDLRTWLAALESRARIRRLPVPQLYYGVKQLAPKDVGRLLPHLSEEQWQGIVDLDIWSRDSADIDRFLNWQQWILEAEDAVARKLIRALDRELWVFLFRKTLLVEECSDAQRESEDRDWMETPDQNLRIGLPEDPDKSKLLRQLIHRLYDLDSEQAADLIQLSRQALTLELEEQCYQQRKRRIEELGFQDYFDALDVYAHIREDEPLPVKKIPLIREAGTMPATATEDAWGSLLLLRALSTFETTQETQAALEELFYVCNKVLSADRVSPADPDQVKRAIRKAVAGMNLGLDWWSGGNLARAVEGARNHYLQSFFQLGYGILTRRSLEAKQLREQLPPPPGGIEDEIFAALVDEGFPRKAELKDQRVVKRFFQTRQDVAEVDQFLRQWRERGKP